MRTVRRVWIVSVVAMAMTLLASTGVGAADFANTQFRDAYYLGEQIAPNFWGPAEHASDAYSEPYNGGKRIVQYFDKGRMEITNGQLTFGLLASQMVTGRVQIGDNDFRQYPPSLVKIAGDENGLGPSYRTISENRTSLLDPKAQRTGDQIYLLFDRQSNLVDAGKKAGSGVLALTNYDATTRHNVIAPFNTYRNSVGFSTIGLAISEPFAAYFTVGGVERAVAVQVFERRVLTYTEDNPTAYRVEMGNIGRHFFNYVYNDR